MSDMFENMNMKCAFVWRCLTTNTKYISKIGHTQLPTLMSTPISNLVTKQRNCRDRGGGGAGRAIALPLLWAGFIS